MKLLKAFLFVFISFSFVFGNCSKDDDDATTPDNADKYQEPVLKSNETWLYMTSSLPEVYASNYIGADQIRPLGRKWIATDIIGGHATSIKNTAANAASDLSDIAKNSFTFSFENKDKFTRFCTDINNPNGKEVVTIWFNNFNREPGPSSNTIDNSPNNYKVAQGWYYVYKQDGQLYDTASSMNSFILPTGNGSTFTVNTMTFVSSDAVKDIYKMSGTGHFLIPHWISSSQAVGINMECVFTNVVVWYVK